MYYEDVVNVKSGRQFKNQELMLYYHDYDKTTSASW